MAGQDPEPPRCHLFAYGTLASGGPAPVVAAMAENTRRIGPASVRGRLHDSGDWPAMVPSANSADRVPGWLFEVLDPRRLWPVLDAWEGCGADDPRPHLFHREKRQVKLLHGASLSAFVYLFAGDVTGWPRIARWPPDPVDPPGPVDPADSAGSSETLP